MKTLILVRHAHRDNSHRELDNGLTEKGKKQAQWVRKFALGRMKEENWDKGKIQLISSPKVRCVETLEPLGKSLELKVQASADLIEMQNRETVEQMDQRIHRFLRDWTSKSMPITIICSHGDWLPLAAFHLLGVSIDFKKGTWAEIEWHEGRAHLQWIVRSFKPFYD